MPRNIRLLLAYDGTEFHGWQTQPGLRTVQDTVEQAIRRVVRHQVTVVGSGRTDAGVHARGQVANFHTSHPMSCERLRHAIGGRLPKDVSIIEATEAPPAFWASRDAVSKLYRYTIHNSHHRPVETHRQRYVYHFWHPLDVDQMQAAAGMLVGEHDFAALATRGSPRQSTIRRIFHLDVYRHYEQVYVDVEGNGFLYNQVRNIVGTLIEIGRGHWPVERMAAILASGDRTQAGPTAPARGLCLQWVRYDLPALEAAAAEFADAEENLDDVAAPLDADVPQAVDPDE